MKHVKIKLVLSKEKSVDNFLGALKLVAITNEPSMAFMEMEIHQI